VTALGWRTLRGQPVRKLPPVIALPAAAFFALAFVSLLWADDVEAGANLLAFFTLPFAALLATVARAEFPELVPRTLAAIALGLAALFAAVGLWQAATHELFFYAPNLAVSNANKDYFRVTSLFGDPSLYGRHVVLGLGIALVLLATGRWRTWPLVGLVALMWAGLLFSYSQSSMAALLLVSLAIAFATGDRRVRMAVGGLAAAAALAAGFDMLRVDFYEHDGELWFGELTPYPGAGLSPLEPDLDAFLGAAWTLPPLQRPRGSQRREWWVRPG
jgi:hypothetical protein